MKLRAKRVLDELLSAEEPCLGAAFCSYTFDPKFFEEQVLRVLLRLRTDPEEHASMFHEEARRALQECPVVALVDASMRQAGRRLPYDQVLVRSRTFHPKLVLALYAEHARLLIGSANLTRGGYDENLELLHARSLRYDDAADAATLREVDEFLTGCAELAQAAGTQLQLVRDELRRRLQAGAASGTPKRQHVLVSSLQRPILDQLFDRIPEDAAITRVGVLAPFYEKDDEAALHEEGLGSFLNAVASRRRTRDLVLDLASGWDDAPVAPEAGVVHRVEECLERLCAWRWIQEMDDERREGIEYLVPLSIASKTIAYRAANGSSRRIERDVFESAASERRLWAVKPPELPVPDHVLQHLALTNVVNLWAHPATSLDERGRVQRRPLHAKLFLVTTVRRRRERTWVLLGSPNASRRAMLRSVAENGNVELAVLSCVDRSVTLSEVLPSLVQVERERVELIQREMPAAEPDLSAWIRDAVHGPAARDLIVHWADEGPAPLGPWRLEYGTRVVAHGEGPPAGPTRVEDFDLLPTSAELELVVGGREYPVPIRVSDLAELPTTANLVGLDLRELLALLGRRIGSERLATLRAEGGQAGAAGLLESIFGIGFGPVDVFKAWWGLAHDLEQPISVPAFRHRLRGPLGVWTVWERLREEISRSISADEAWIYGCELLRVLRQVSLPEGPDEEAKRALLDELIAALDPAIGAIRPMSEGRPWLEAVARFYDHGGADA